MSEKNISQPTVVYDTVVDAFLDNKVLSNSVSSQYSGASFWHILFKEVTKRGWMMLSSDLFLKNPKNYPNTYLVSDMFTSRTKLLISHGVVPTVCLSGESPNVAWDFYSKVVSNKYDFKHYYLFQGVKKFFKDEVNISQLYWPNDKYECNQGLNWEEKRFLALIASNKGRYASGRGGLGMHVMRKLLWFGLQRMNSMFDFEDLYEARLSAINYFSHSDDFDLLGRDWDKKKQLTKKEYEAVQRCYSGAIEDKLDVLKKYKFSICFENCVFPGYITEKLFDCFFSGCIPIYMGAPDIDTFIPKGTYIDFREYGNFQELEKYIREITIEGADVYLLAAREFLASDAFKKFTDRNLTTDILKTLDGCVNQC